MSSSSETSSRPITSLPVYTDDALPRILYNATVVGEQTLLFRKTLNGTPVNVENARLQEIVAHHLQQISKLERKAFLFVLGLDSETFPDNLDNPPRIDTAENDLMSLAVSGVRLRYHNDFGPAQYESRHAA
jgi:hypothetical protein